MKIINFLTLILATAFVACSGTIAPSSDIINQPFPRVEGRNQNQEAVTIPDRYLGKPTLLLIGYAQRAQFDIDRWILGVLQADVKVEIVEIPTIAGMMPQMVQGFIDNGMRSGIPKSDWASVVTVYKDAPKIIATLGNERPQSAYVVLLDNKGKMIWSSNIGYSAAQVLELKRVVEESGSR